MSLFPRFPSNDASSLFQLLDDYNTHAKSGSKFSSSVRAFTPKFDVREHKGSYELQGELPGLDQKDVHVAFADPHTLVIKGHVERDYSSEGARGAQGRITGDVTDAHAAHHASVEDEEEDAGAKKDATNGNANDAGKSNQVSKQSDQGHPKYWVAERSVGEFHRAFTFPSRVDQDAVKARLNNGILNVTVPKATEHKAKRIEVE